MAIRRALFGLFGAGGHGRSTMPIVAAALRRASPDDIPLDIVFVEREVRTPAVNGWPVMSEQTYFATPYVVRYFNVAIADSGLRQRIADRCISKGATPLPIIADNAVLLNPTAIDAGVLLSGFVTIGANVTIGRFFHANLYSYVEHDCIIGDYVTFAPGVKCNGNVHIGDHAFVGSGAILRDGRPERPITIGRGAAIGMGAVVTGDVPPGVTVVGNPARILKAHP
jgi:sugar O-acyltransferase (sialic acid O-acetyltransferase NeuD family)